METNGHRNGQTGPRHGGTSPVNGKPPANGQSPVINGALPMSRSPFAPPPEPPPLYAPSPFAAAGNPLTPDQPADPYGSTYPSGAADEPDDEFDLATARQEDDLDHDLAARRPVSGLPTATGSAQVPMQGEDEPDAWGPPSGTAAAGPRVAESLPGPLGPFPGAFAPQRPGADDPVRPATQPVADQPDQWVLPEAGSGSWTPFRTEASPHQPVRSEPAEGGRRARSEAIPADLEPAATEDGPLQAPDARNHQMEMAMEATRTGRRAAEDGPLRPGDLDHSPITFWDEAASAQFRAEWHEVKAQFVDDPTAALTRAHDLLSEAVQQLSQTMLTTRDELDPLQGAATPDTESMRMAMRGYREFLDRILAL